MMTSFVGLCHLCQLLFAFQVTETCYIYKSTFLSTQDLVSQWLRSSVKSLLYPSWFKSHVEDTFLSFLPFFNSFFLQVNFLIHQIISILACIIVFLC